MLSMTGMGRACRHGITCEVRSSNHRHLEINSRLPPELEEFSEEFKEIIRSFCHRGSFFLTLRVGDKYLPVSISKERLKRYISLFNLIKNDFHIRERINYSDIINLPGLFVITPAAKKRLFCAAKAVCREAVKKLCEMRREEGGNLLKDFRRRLKKINRYLEEIKGRIPKRLEEKKQAYLKKFPETVPEDRIREEVAIFSDRTDVTEELTRLFSHSRLFQSAMSRKDTSGRKLEFILQEMLREAETLSAKARDFSISKKVIEIKEEIEKMREQAKNVE